MSLLRLVAIGITMVMVTACSTTSDCNDIASESQVSELENKVGDRVFFEFDSSAITADAQETLRRQAQFIADNPDLRFVIEGHCDERGTRDYNLGLGERRANAVKQYLVSLGVNANRLTVVSYGKERPAVLGSNDWAWSQNRRAVTKAE